MLEMLSYGHLPRNIAGRDWKHVQKRDACCRQQGGWEAMPFKHFKVLGTRHGAIGFAVFTPGFQSYFGPMFSHYTPFLPLRRVIHILCSSKLEHIYICLYNVVLLFDFDI